MAPSFDCSTSNLLCAEDNNSIMSFADGCDGFLSFSGGNAWLTQNHRTLNQNQSFHGGEFSIGFPLQTEECLSLMVDKECQHLPRDDYLKRLQSGELDLGIRRKAVDWIRKVHAYYSFGPLSAYLSINYLDRFLSAYELPRGKSWMMQLLAVACLSLATKMDEKEVPLPLDLQIGDSKFVFEARTIKRMELLVLSTLEWRMQAVTPFSFIDNFLRQINDDEQLPPKMSLSRAVQLISSTIKGIDFLDFRPSEVAAAVAISVSSENQTVDIDKAVSCFIHVKKERVLKCLELIQDVSLISESCKVPSASAPSVPQSPIGVLDAAACLSYKTDETVRSCANASHTTPDAKRRKLNRPSEVES
ncbi:cyclin-D3-1-like [Telopea speciosissima]|uniref:cyclin-D3-1-like n=1 Tax=Telopea speciosissima TaxID=54955 RepID=UPI001CC343D0|nr:cyclin-D3-1-like [Telopea speciosissima]XP_043713751.1 cyclin-D3-1-like [Telopea speciosissima]